MQELIGDQTRNGAFTDVFLALECAPVEDFGATYLIAEELFAETNYGQQYVIYTPRTLRIFQAVSAISRRLDLHHWYLAVGQFNENESHQKALNDYLVLDHCKFKSEEAGVYRASWATGSTYQIRNRVPTKSLEFGWIEFGFAETAYEVEKAIEMDADWLNVQPKLEFSNISLRSVYYSIDGFSKRQLYLDAQLVDYDKFRELLSGIAEVMPVVVSETPGKLKTFPLPAIFQIVRDIGMNARAIGMPDGLLMELSRLHEFRVVMKDLDNNLVVALEILRETLRENRRIWERYGAWLQNGDVR